MGSCFLFKSPNQETHLSELNLLKHKTQDQLTAKHATTYLITCMDFRLLDDICRAMDNMGYNNDYDQFIIAGASLGFCQTKYPHWRQTVMDHLEIGLNLHKFRQFIFIDHIDCGAFKKFYPEIDNIKEEEEFHKINLQNAHDIIKKKFPDFEFKAYLMDLYGEIDEIKIDISTKTPFSEVVEDNFLSSIDDELIERKQSNYRRSLRKKTENHH